MNIESSEGQRLIVMFQSELKILVAFKKKIVMVNTFMLSYGIRIQQGYI